MLALSMYLIGVSEYVNAHIPNSIKPVINLERCCIFIRIIFEGAENTKQIVQDENFVDEWIK
jgi:hypothetical protein